MPIRPRHAYHSAFQRLSNAPLSTEYEPGALYLFNSIKAASEVGTNISQTLRIHLIQGIRQKIINALGRDHVHVEEWDKEIFNRLTPEQLSNDPIWKASDAVLSFVSDKILSMTQATAQQHLEKFYTPKEVLSKIQQALPQGVSLPSVQSSLARHYMSNRQLERYADLRYEDQKLASRRMGHLVDRPGKPAKFPKEKWDLMFEKLIEQTEIQNPTNPGWNLYNEENWRKVQFALTASYGTIGLVAPNRAELHGESRTIDSRRKAASGGLEQTLRGSREWSREERGNARRGRGVDNKIKDDATWSIIEEVVSRNPNVLVDFAPKDVLNAINTAIQVLQRAKFVQKPTSSRENTDSDPESRFGPPIHTRARSKSARSHRCGTSSATDTANHHPQLPATTTSNRRRFKGHLKKVAGSWFRSRSPHSAHSLAHAHALLSHRQAAIYGSI
ncbi:hypothetical protein JCM5350_006435 [Sporobolomyces pararoseus]